MPSSLFKKRFLYWLAFLSCGFTLNFCLLGISYKQCILHLVFILSCHLLFILFLSLEVIAGPIKLILAFIYQFFLISTYLLIVGGLFYWSDIITIKTVSTYLSDIPSFCNSLSISLWFLILAICIYSLFIALSIYLFRRDIQKVSVRLSPVKIAVAGFIFLFLITPVKRFFHFRNEPFLIFSFDRMWGENNNPFFNLYRIKVGREDEMISKKYFLENKSDHAVNRNVVLIVCDALRADHLPMYRYNRNTTPFLNQLYQTNQLLKVENCISTSASTVCGVPSLMLGREWKSCSIKGFNLFKLLKGYGLETHALIAGAHKEWYNIARFYTNDCDHYFDGKDSKQYYFKDDRVVLEGLKNVKSKSSKSLLYIHIQSPHETALLRDSFAIWKPFRKVLPNSSDRLIRLTNLYDNKILQADDIIKKTFQLLEQKGILQDALIIITADHGEGLGEHGVDGHVDWLYQAQTNVPLLIIDKKNEYQNLKFARQIDIAPTIADALHIPIPICWQGTSLLKKEIKQYSFHETGKNGLETQRQQYAIVSYQDSVIYKYIFSKKAAQIDREELYELKSDPEEKYNLNISEQHLNEGYRQFANKCFNAHFDLGN